MRLVFYLNDKIDLQTISKVRENIQNSGCSQSHSFRLIHMHFDSTMFYKTAYGTYTKDRSVVGNANTFEQQHEIDYNFQYVMQYLIQIFR